VKEQGRILIVDREPEWRRFIVETLQKHGYTVYLGSDAQTTLREIVDDNFDLIVVDALLLDWLDTPAIQRICHRLLVVTAAPSVPEAVGAFRRGALDYVSKAFDAPSLLSIITLALTKQPALQQSLT
jgi:DNA-binding response OmpR family regulator